MAEELTLGQARASDDDNDEPSKEELQRRMEEARETITQTVTEIKETVTNQYYSMKESVSDALDWRHHFRNNPIAFSVGALSVGFLVGYGITGALKSDGRGGDDEDYPSSEETDVYARVNASPSRYEDESDETERRSAFHGHSYASQPITDQTSETSGDELNYAQAAGGSLSYSAPRDETPQKPGLYERFKETSAYDRLQTEVSTLGDRFMEELSSTAHNVVLPALFNKLKELFGVDLSNKLNQQSQGNQSSAQTSNAPETNTGARAASASASSASASRGSSDSSYATSENRGYGAQATASETDKGGEGSSVLDLDR